MAYYRSWWHTKYDCRYHVVWVTKMRYKWINQDIKPIIEDMIREICKKLFVTIISIWMENDHVHLYLSIPLNTWYIPDVIQKLKWRTSKELWGLKEFESYFKKFYRKQWVGKRATWYFICTVWEVNDTIIQQYVEQEWQEHQTLN